MNHLQGIPWPPSTNTILSSLQSLEMVSTLIQQLPLPTGACWSCVSTFLLSWVLPQFSIPARITYCGHKGRHIQNQLLVFHPETSWPLPFIPTDLIFKWCCPYYYLLGSPLLSPSHSHHIPCSPHEVFMIIFFFKWNTVSPNFSPGHNHSAIGKIEKQQRSIGKCPYPASFSRWPFESLDYIRNILMQQVCRSEPHRALGWGWGVLYSSTEQQLIASTRGSVCLRSRAGEHPGNGNLHFSYKHVLCI